MATAISERFLIMFNILWDYYIFSQAYLYLFRGFTAQFMDIYKFGGKFFDNYGLYMISSNISRNYL